MCGIAGFALADGIADPGEAALRRMVQTLGHRGPDGSGAWTQPRVGLGHARLSIIDIQGGAQPMQIANGALTISFNGEIYNYKELARELTERGHRFESRSDTEVILRMYEEYGEEFVSRLNGMFAFAIWDARDRTVLLARDRMGEKPLYYSDGNGQLLFASELKALRAFPGLELTVCEYALDDYLAYGYVPEPRSIYRQVRKLLPAHYMVWREGRSKIVNYWNTAGLEPAGNGHDYVDQFEELLLDSMRIRLRSDVPVGAFLSGGVDSSIIAWAASKQYPDTLSTYTIGFEEASWDESEGAEFTARYLGTRHTTKIVKGISLAIMPELVAQYDEPFGDPSAVPTYYVTREASSDLKVCLSGDGGDELFGGYPQYRWEPMERILGSVPLGMRKALLTLPAVALPEHFPGYGFLQRMMTDGARRYQQKIGVFSPAERKALLQPAYEQIVDEDARLLCEFFEQSADEMRARQIADLHTYLPGDILVKVDRSSMAHSLEVRTPFLDHRIVEFAQTLPREQHIAAGNQKVILRNLLKRHLPGEILDRPKKGFGMPLRNWFRGEYRDFVAERLLVRDAKVYDYLDPGAVRQLVEAHNKGQRDFADRIWALLWLEEWFRQFA